MKRTFSVPAETTELLDRIASSEGMSREEALGSALGFLEMVLGNRHGKAPYRDVREFYAVVPVQRRFWTSWRNLRIFPVTYAQTSDVSPVEFDLSANADQYIRSVAAAYRDTTSRAIRDGVALFANALEHAQQRHSVMFGYPGVGNVRPINVRSFLTPPHWPGIEQRTVA